MLNVVFMGLMLFSRRELVTEILSILMLPVVLDVYKRQVIDHIDLNKYLTTEERRTGRPRYDEKTLLKVILFLYSSMIYSLLYGSP